MKTPAGQSDKEWGVGNMEGAMFRYVVSYGFSEEWYLNIDLKR